MTAPDRRQRFRGCLLGGAAGDALGAAIEFLSLDEVRTWFGPAGIQDFAPGDYGLGRVTDDTQMTLWTAEGLIRAHVRHAEKGICHPPSVVHGAYLRWLVTQDERPRPGTIVARDGWLFGVEALHAQRAPGMTCLSALRATATLGEPARNNSKGCGGVMRVAPCGLVGGERAFDLAADCAALTHGHPTGFLSAGALGEIIAALVAGETLDAALDRAQAELAARDGHAETLRALHGARTLAAKGRPSGEAIETLGGGWVAEEALAIAVAASLSADDLADGCRIAVNHSGDADSTGAIAGNILGCLHGEAAIPDLWLELLELRAEIGIVADDLLAVVAGTLDTGDEGVWARYPGY